MINKTYLLAAALLALSSCQKSGAEPDKKDILTTLPEAINLYSPIM